MLPLMRSRAARMSSSVIMGINRSVQTFDVCLLRFAMLAQRPVRLSANFLRGQFGKALHDTSPDMYQRLFAPRTKEGPSGLLDAPRPFVFRVRDVEGVHLAPGDNFEIGINLFETHDAPIELIRTALCSATGGECLRVSGVEPVRLGFERSPDHAGRVRLRFLTATELKPVATPEFGVLFARIRDRVSTLRALYGDGPLAIDFRAMAERAAAIRMIRSELRRVEAERGSRSTGQRHSLGGFAGEAEYEGDIGEFIPYLEAARYTGVGRQTVWGKGEIAWETF